MTTLLMDAKLFKVMYIKQYNLSPQESKLCYILAQSNLQNDGKFESFGLVQKYGTPLEVVPVFGPSLECYGLLFQSQLTQHHCDCISLGKDLNTPEGAFAPLNTRVPLTPWTTL